MPSVVTSVRCSGTTRANVRCARTTTNPSGDCGRHIKPSERIPNVDTAPIDQSTGDWTLPRLQEHFEELIDDYDSYIDMDVWRLKDVKAHLYGLLTIEIENIIDMVCVQLDDHADFKLERIVEELSETLEEHETTTRAEAESLARQQIAPDLARRNIQVTAPHYRDLANDIQRIVHS